MESFSYSLSHTLEDEDIGIDRETDREYDSCYRGKCESDTSRLHESDKDD